MGLILSIESSCDDSYYKRVQKESKTLFSTLTLGLTRRQAHVFVMLYGAI